MHVEDIDVYVQDVIQHVELMKNKYPHLPCILMGHSMVGFNLLLTVRYDGVGFHLNPDCNKILS